ncbi:DUF433 domain-containing protein [cf. Phormidesmis sp. LEGE 11477]|uniref:DUF433 domain-containing protein n=1 Tax=cf. Phormidesmis sp. LEGE 11477 TaxID=1828680 RepID=UPI00187E06D4|nr:DUF433 domain-containing protein [cf. Phormidesmis sp. LEGE 11477]MBE9060607.1 DUF433 domain-containing protein [cf. Phormidesmis sp. LEGE 11477]
MIPNSVKSQLLALSAAEKALIIELLSESITNTWNGIEKTPGVCGGDACIKSTRIPVWILVQSRGLGSSEVDILRDYPTLSANDLVNAWAYADNHLEEIEQAICDNNEA